MADYRNIWLNFANLKHLQASPRGFHSTQEGKFSQKAKKLYA